MQRISLNGTWKLNDAKATISIPAQVPGDTHSALLAARKIADPYVGTHELDVQWIGRTDWTYSRTFTVAATMLDKASIFLNCDVLDTIAEVRINGARAGTTENMFRRYRFEIKTLLNPGVNAIDITFHSAENAAIAAARKMPYTMPFSPAPVQSPNRNLIRKVQCHAGWDWGPCLMVAGIYGEIWIGATELGRIEHVYTTQHHSKGRCAIDVACEVQSPCGGKTTMEIGIDGETVRTNVTLVPGLNTVRSRFVVRKPRLWWPNGLGAQPLYSLTIRVAGDEVTKKLGLRTLEVVSKEDKHGLSLVFRVNGIDVFGKGADWIPCDALPQRQTRAAMGDLITSAQMANMNMLRVWGGGQYESEDFYDLCDEKGLLIWQDFMFACALYPATPDFLDNVREEAVYQVKRLRDHACIALWCGNNEDVGALNWYEEARKNRDRYLVDYDRLNEGVLGNVTRELDPARVFWPSSPCGGPGDYSDAFHQDNRGDMHYWAVWHEGRSFDAYYKVTPRFCSEFGYQSFPSMEAIRRYAPRNQLNVTAPVMEHHQRNGGGNSKIIEMFTRYFRMPEGFGSFVYLSQVQQGLAIKTAVEHWRHLRPICMGTIYWQLNDNWPVASWASLEYGGKWKLLHYMAKRFFATTIVSAFQRDDGTVEVWVTNDGLTKQPGEVTIRVIDFAGKQLHSEKLSVAIAPESAKLVKTLTVSKITPKPEAAFMVLELKAGGVIFTNEHFFCAYKKCELPSADVTASVKEKHAGFSVTLSTDAPAFYVSANMTGIAGEFNDNCITLLPGKARVLTFMQKKSTTLVAVRRALSVQHLRLTYQ